MIILSDPTDRLLVDIAPTISTNPIPVVATWRLVNAVTHKFGRVAVAVVDGTPTDIISPPPTGYEKVIDYISVYNNDTVAHFVDLVLKVSTVDYILHSVLLGQGEKLEYTDESGFRVLSNNGAIKQVYTNGTSPIGSNVNMVVLSSPVVNNNGTANTMQDVTGLSFAVNAGSRYRFKFVIYYTAALTTTGSRWSVNGPGSPTELNYDSDYSLTVTTRTINTGQNAYDLPAASNASSASTAANIAIIEGVIVPSANGTVIARFASEVLSSAITARPGSYVEYQQLT